LLRNEKQQFVCRNIYISSSGEQNGEPLKIPVAHGEGRYHADEKTLESMLLNKQIQYRYCDREGRINSEANPNGALLNIAGISNREGNVTGMMPHPERACNKIFLGNDDGKKIFRQLYGLN
jgi:phosphoribosylformylglycinamidine (FGAM) synthase-like amidotransferase family enzyme